MVTVKKKPLREGARVVDVVGDDEFLTIGQWTARAATSRPAQWPAAQDVHAGRRHHHGVLGQARPPRVLLPLYLVPDAGHHLPRRGAGRRAARRPHRPPPGTCTYEESL